MAWVDRGSWDGASASSCPQFVRVWCPLVGPASGLSAAWAAPCLQLCRVAGGHASGGISTQINASRNLFYSSLEEFMLEPTFSRKWVTNVFRLVTAPDYFSEHGRRALRAVLWDVAAAQQRFCRSWAPFCCHTRPGHHQ